MPIDRAYTVKRMRLLFNKGPLFYAEYNIRLFLLILFKRADLYFANDLDTLLAMFLVSKIKGKSLVYDSHEYYIEVPELVGRPLVKKVWQRIEKSIFPKVQAAITVNDSIAALYEQQYKRTVHVIRNVSSYKVPVHIKKQDLQLPEVPIIILQGAGINMHRGAEEMVQAMQYLENILLLIIGSGDVIPMLKKSVETLQLQQKVKFINKLPAHELAQYTAVATIGLSLDKDTNLNYRFSLPNKLFDYIQARVPVLVSALPEVEKIVRTYAIGEVLEQHTPEHIAYKIKMMLQDEKRLNQWKENLNIASEELCWEKEKIKLKHIITSYA